MGTICTGDEEEVIEIFGGCFLSRKCGDKSLWQKRAATRVTNSKVCTNKFIKEKFNMCGIVGYVGDNSASPILIDGLKKLEYRGYDSAGIAVSDGEKITIVKTSGRLSELTKKLSYEGAPKGTVGIGHTRWATHGAPTDRNAHPHSSENGRITLVHNGIIENYAELRLMLQNDGYHFVSDTDTEVVAHLFDSFYKGDELSAMVNVMNTVRGSFALAVMIADKPGKLLAARKDSPLVIGKGKGENFIASDIPALLCHTRECYLLKDNELALIDKNNIKIFNKSKEPVDREAYHVTWEAGAAEKGGFEHFMKKEIFEQPKAIKDTISPRINDGKVKIDELTLTNDEIKSIGKIHIVACGSAWHVGMAAKYIFEKLAKIPCETDLASEFRYRNPIIKKGDICIPISQSGETADTLAALREAKKNGAKVISVVNVVASTIARESDNVIYTLAGPEIAVATTKAFSAQLAVIYLLALKFASVNGSVTEEDEKSLTAELLKLPEAVKRIVNDDEKIKNLAQKYRNAKDLFFIGRGLDYAISLEGSLKLKEISYIHSESYAAGELKHGTISLIEDGTPVIAVATQNELYEKTLSNIKEVKARGARVLMLINDGKTPEEFADDVISVPDTAEIFKPSLNVVPLQLFAYYMSVLRGNDVDKPRNLAKSVTVE